MSLPRPQPQSLPGAPHSPLLLSGIAAQMAALATEAEKFGVVLCCDADVASRYLVQLQQIDRLAQSLREMAEVLRAADPATAVAAIRLGDLRLALEDADAV